MKGIAKSTPTSHVEWANGFKSNMPDWPTARVCGVSSQMLYALKDCRTVLLAIQRPGAFSDAYDEQKISSTLQNAMKVIDQADGMDTVLSDGRYLSAEWDRNQPQSLEDLAKSFTPGPPLAECRPQENPYLAPMPLREFPKPPGVK